MLRLILGLAILAVVGVAVPPLVNWSTGRKGPHAPQGMDSNAWSAIVSRGPGGNILGHLERILSFAAFWQGAAVVIAGSLAFKVASGWQNWQVIVRLPEKIDNVDDLDYLRARSQLGSWIFQRFLIGTLGNILAGLIAAAIAKGI